MHKDTRLSEFQRIVKDAISCHLFYSLFKFTSPPTITALISTNLKPTAAQFKENPQTPATYKVSTKNNLQKNTKIFPTPVSTL